MTLIVLVKTIHYICLALLLYSSGMKNLLLTPRVIRQEVVQRVRRFDKLSGAAAGVILLSGLAMLLWLAKPSSYYFSSSIFLLKIIIFILASSLIVLTKASFRKALRGIDANNQSSLWVVPRHVRLILRIDFLGLPVMALIGFSVARGYV